MFELCTQLLHSFMYVVHYNTHDCPMQLHLPSRSSRPGWRTSLTLAGCTGGSSTSVPRASQPSNTAGAPFSSTAAPSPLRDRGRGEGGGGNTLEYNHHCSLAAPSSWVVDEGREKAEMASCVWYNCTLSATFLLHLHTQLVLIRKGFGAKIFLFYYNLIGD